ncbi:hypothetical protein QQX09_06170 [Demequina sp. SYSU T00192]|uniref:Uncharacterized protein n=1 Tax=Demequina litoralis TaxID=3051660 RepID=A0ABT8G8Q2_9MICO|nr:hypothetical protein [Demequina sp. SYSU T00192]MDN4475437.1 hypothetical protein [Demequina sp. SYSU T00192]
MAIESTNTSDSAGISRRRLVQGAAWATPAILIATAAPAGANGSGQFAPTVSAVSATYAASGGLTVQRADDASAYAVDSLEIQIETNKVPDPDKKFEYFPVAGEDTSDDWSTQIENNVEGKGNAKHSANALVSMKLTGSLNDGGASALTWAFTNLGTITKVTLRATWGPSNTVIGPLTLYPSA